MYKGVILEEWTVETCVSCYVVACRRCVTVALPSITMAAASARVPVSYPSLSPVSTLVVPSVVASVPGACVLK